MNGRTSRSRDVESYRDHHGDQGGREGAGSSRRRGHDPVPGEIDIDGAPMAVDRCRDCGIVVLDSRRPGGPCPGRNHTLTEFGVTPPTDHDGEANPPAGRPVLVDRRRKSDRPSETGRHGETDRREDADREDGPDTTDGMEALLASR